MLFSRRTPLWLRALGAFILSVPMGQAIKLDLESTGTTKADFESAFALHLPLTPLAIKPLT